MNIHQYINPHRLSNTYLLELEDDLVVLVDIGNLDTTVLLNWLVENGKTITHVLLTHEHADHCCGLDSLYKTNPFELICTASCAKNIKNSRQNFSFYLEDIPEFEVQLDTISKVKDDDVREIGGQMFTFIATPGHSPGGMCIVVANHLFTGDTILNGIKSPLTFPHSNRKEYQISIQKLKNILTKGMIIYPGHDSIFVYQSFEELYI
jgi:glyoxylase-like metal-dependent hydrolase (beta-lactamase superfamily II)